METRDISLYYFTLVANELNISSTAKSISISQQALSKHIQRLEKDFGVQLFVREPSLQLTSEGQRVLAYAKRVLAEERGLRHSLKEGYQNMLRFPVGMVNDSADMIIAPLYEKFRLRRPDNMLAFATCTYGTTINLINRGKIKVAFGLLHAFGDYFTKVPLYTDDMFLILKRDTLYKMPENIRNRFIQSAECGLSIETLCESGLPLILPWSASSIGSFLIDRFHIAGANPEIIAETCTFAELFGICRTVYSGAIVRKSQLYCNLSFCMAEEIMIFPLKELEEKETVGIVYHENMEDDPAIQDFIECAKEIGEEIPDQARGAIQQYIKQQFM